MLKKILNSNLSFGVVVGIFIISMFFTTQTRGGKDLKVFLYGAQQTLEKKSPYDNLTDPNRTIFRYAPGFAILMYPFILKSKVTAPFEFQNIYLSVFVWYITEIIALLLIFYLLFKLVPAATKEAGLINLKLSFLAALPLIGYEISNCQNKLFALLLMLASLLLFERNRVLLSASLFCLALTIYIPLSVFGFYFVLKKKTFLPAFFIAAILTFILVPSLVFGFNFNNILLKEWFSHSIAPFVFTNNYTSYVDLRNSNQALPGAIGRIFVRGHTGNFRYLIPPYFIHIVIRVFSAAIFFLSLLAVCTKSKNKFQRLDYSIFFILALVLPQYCIYYTWSWIFVLYFTLFNYLSYPEIPAYEKKSLLILAAFLYISICLIGFPKIKFFSLICWTTLTLWLGMTIILIRKTSENLKTNLLSFSAYRNGVTTHFIQP